MAYYCKFLAGLAFDARFWQRNQRGIAGDGRRGALRPLQNFNLVLKLGYAAQLNVQIGAVARDLRLERAQLHAQHRAFVPRDCRARRYRPGFAAFCRGLRATTLGHRNMLAPVTARDRRVVSVAT